MSSRPEDSEEYKKLEEELKVEKRRADSLLAERDHLHLQRKMLADLVWPVIKDYLDARGGQDIAIVQKRSSIAIDTVREPVRFVEDSPEGAVIKLAKAGRLVEYQTGYRINKLLKEIGYNFDKRTVKAALDKLAMSPYHLLDKKRQSNNAWAYRLNKDEAEQALNTK